MQAAISASVVEVYICCCLMVAAPLCPSLYGALLPLWYAVSLVFLRFASSINWYVLIWYFRGRCVFCRFAFISLDLLGLVQDFVLSYPVRFPFQVRTVAGYGANIPVVVTTSDGRNSSIDPRYPRFSYKRPTI